MKTEKDKFEDRISELEKERDALRSSLESEQKNALAAIKEAGELRAQVVKRDIIITDFVGLKMALQDAINIYKDVQKLEIGNKLLVTEERIEAWEKALNNVSQ